MQYVWKTLAASILFSSAGAALAQQGETVKIAWLDPLSGLMAALGTNQMKSWQYLAEEFSKDNPAGVKFEIIPIDNKLSPQETTSALRSAMDQGVRYVVQGNGSGPALAIMDALEKHNARNKGKEVLYLNYAAVDPDLTNSKCSYWHFRLDADTSMKMAALTSYIQEMPDVKKVYLLNQNYAHGHQVSKYAKEMLKQKRPDIEIVGDDMTPLAQVRDFSPYIAKIKQSGADTVITGNWGSDLALMIKAANDAGLNDVKFYTYYGATTGVPTAMGQGAAGKVYQVAYAYTNLPGAFSDVNKGFKAKFNDDMYTGAVYHGLAMLTEAFQRAKSTDPVKVAAVMEGMKFNSFNGEVEMRKDDHQLQQGLFISRWEKTNADNPVDMENTGMTFVPVKSFDASVASTPTTCQMKRPS